MPAKIGAEKQPHLGGVAVAWVVFALSARAGKVGAVIRSASLLDYLDRLPPNVCRLIARENWRTPITNAQIAERSGLTLQQVIFISKLKSWRQVPVGHADAFRTACGINMTNAWRQVFYLKRTFDETSTIHALKHLDKLTPRKQRRMLKLLEPSSHK